MTLSIYNHDGAFYAAATMSVVPATPLPPLASEEKTNPSDKMYLVKRMQVASGFCNLVLPFISGVIH